MQVISFGAVQIFQNARLFKRMRINQYLDRLAKVRACIKTQKPLSRDPDLPELGVVNRTCHGHRIHYQ